MKVLPASFAADKERLTRFTLEAQSAGALNHPNILTVYDIGEHDGAPYMIAELLEGQSLRERLRAGKPSVSKAVDYARQLAAGLAAAHAKGITHRDIKPENIFITKDGRAKILDFGLAKVSGPVKPNDGATRTVAPTEPGKVMGTVGYMSPEQVRGQAVDFRSDIFSFGVVLYEMLSGARAFERDTAAETMTAILKEDPPDLSTVDAALPPALDRLVRHCLEKSPDERFQSARDIAFDLETVTQTSGKISPIAGAVAPKRNWPLTAAALLAPVLAVACAVLAYLYLRPVTPIRFQRLTFGRGFIHAARFTPDGNSVVYSAQWEDNPIEVFTTRFDTVGARALGFSGSALRSISSTGELALAQNIRVVANSFTPAGTLARAPFSGGTPRPTEDKIDFAEWSPDGAELAIVRETDLGTQLEFPAGKILYKTAGYISEPRISRDGSRVAFLDHPLANDNGGSVAVVDRAGNLRTVGSKYIAAAGLAWSPSGDELWFTAAKTGARLDLRAVTLGGSERVLLASSVSMVLEDVAKDGRVLIANTEDRMKLMFRGSSDKADRELSWLDWSLLNSLSPDGKYVAFAEAGEGAGASYAAYLRETNGAPAVLLGKGTNPILAPDGKFVVVFENDPPAIVIYPVGLGQSKRIPMPGFTISLAGLLADGKHLWFNGYEPSHGRRYYLTDLQGSKPRAVTPEGVVGAGLVLNGKYLAGVASGKMTLFPLEGGEPEPIAGIRDGERVAGWSPDSQWLFVNLRSETPTKGYRLNWKTGQREVMLEVTPADRAGVIFGASGIQVTPDGKAYAYSVSQSLGELHLAEGLK